MYINYRIAKMCYEKSKMNKEIFKVWGLVYICKKWHSFLEFQSCFYLFINSDNYI